MGTRLLVIQDDMAFNQMLLLHSEDEGFVLEGG